MTSRSCSRLLDMGSDGSGVGLWRVLGKNTGRVFGKNGARVLGWSGVGGLGTLLFSILWLPTPRPWPPDGAPPPVHVWVCDRDGQRVLGLDGDAFLVQERLVRQPLEVAPGPEDGLWVLRALGPRGAAGLDLLRLDARGSPAGHLKLQRARCLGPGPGGQARLFAQLGPEWYWLQLDPACRAAFAIPAGNALGWEALPGALVLVGPDWVRRYNWSPLESARAAVSELRLSPRTPVLAHASRAGRLWLLLAGEGAPMLVALNDQLRCCSRRQLDPWPLEGEAVWFLAPAPDDVVWVVGGSGHTSLVRPCGRREHRTRLMAPIHQARARAGELWCASVGGVQRLDQRMLPIPGQGGMEHLGMLGVTQQPLHGP